MPLRKIVTGGWVLPWVTVTQTWGIFQSVPVSSAAWPGVIQEASVLGDPVSDLLEARLSSRAVRHLCICSLLGLGTCAILLNITEG